MQVFVNSLTHPASESPEGLSGTLADITVPGDHGDLDKIVMEESEI